MTPADKAREYAFRDCLEHSARVIDAKMAAYEAGHAAARKEAEELADAVELYKRECANPAVDAIYRRTLRNQMFDKLAAWRGGDHGR